MVLELYSFGWIFLLIFKISTKFVICGLFYAWTPYFERIWATSIANLNTQHFGGRIGYELDDTMFMMVLPPYYIIFGELGNGWKLLNPKIQNVVSDNGVPNNSLVKLAEPNSNVWGVHDKNSPPLIKGFHVHGDHLGYVLWSFWQKNINSYFKILNSTQPLSLERDHHLVA